VVCQFLGELRIGFWYDKLKWLSDSIDFRLLEEGRMCRGDAINQVIAFDPVSTAVTTKSKVENRGIFNAT